MAEVAITINADSPADFAARIKRVKSFAKRLHIDVSDGIFTPHRTPNLAQIYGTDQAKLDLHLMLERPADQISTAISLDPDLVILHFESKGDLAAMIAELQAVGIKAGLALKVDTSVEAAEDTIKAVDHVLVFAGDLGFNQGQFHAEVLPKIAAVKALKPELEVGIDGGVTAETGRQAITAGADVLDSGSYVHNASSPKAAYARLEAEARAGIKS